MALLIFLCTFVLKAQPPLLRTYNYIDSYAEEAIEQMVQFNIPASVILAQAILESRSGTSELAKRSNNHFGIKCHNGWEGDTILKDDDSTNECFRRYASIDESYTDHSLFLSSRPRYASLFYLSVNDFKGWCYGLKNAGYATSPDYADELIKLITDKKLYELDACEKLDRKLLIRKPEAGIKTSKFAGRQPSLYDFAHADLLFLDERDVLVQSLKLHVSKALNELDEIAEK
ncbi:MAG: glucosaminidase domain-containing protein [bacterium]|nr:glucosaminidase domain-containing protein [bacterium]